MEEEANERGAHARLPVDDRPHGGADRVVDRRAGAGIKGDGELAKRRSGGHGSEEKKVQQQTNSAGTAPMIGGRRMSRHCSSTVMIKTGSKHLESPNQLSFDLESVG